MSRTRTTSVEIAYNDLRRALVAVDELDVKELGDLRDRACHAAKKYPPFTTAMRRENDALLSFAAYVDATLEEVLYGELKNVENS